MDKAWERLPPSCANAETHVQTLTCANLTENPVSLGLSPDSRILHTLRNVGQLATIAQMNQTAPKAFTLWWVAVVAFTLICLWPIWSTRFPPLQDYPQHLLQAQLLASTWGEPSEYVRNFEIRLEPTNATFYVVTALLSKLVSIEISGKLAISLYVALVAYLVVKLRGCASGDGPPWGALLLFPLMFNQQYFLGNMNYCYALPLVVLALLDYEELAAQPLTAWRCARQALWQLALFVTHVFAFLAFFLLAVVMSISYRRHAVHIRRTAVAVAVGVVLLCIGIVTVGPTTIVPPATDNPLPAWNWKPVTESLGFGLYMFTGMRWHDGVDAAAVLSWILLAACVATAAFGRSAGTAPGPCSRRFLALFCVAAAAALVLPFSASEYTFINFRMASLAYFLLAVVVAGVRFQGGQIAMFVGLIAVVLAQSVTKQIRISHEIAEIVPIIEKMPPNATILPLIFERTSPELDPVYFDPHLKVHNYYHVLVHGGLSPYFSTSPMRLKNSVRPPAPNEYVPNLFNWGKHGMAYDYFLARGMPADFAVYLAERAELRAESGPWQLYARKQVADTTVK